MRQYSKTEVLEVLRRMVAKANTAQAAAVLGVTPQLVSMVLGGDREISENLALKLGFIKLPDTYMRAPKKAQTP